MLQTWILIYKDQQKIRETLRAILDAPILVKSDFEIIAVKGRVRPLSRSQRTIDKRLEAAIN